LKGKVGACQAEMKVEVEVAVVEVSRDHAVRPTSYHIVKK
jgi:hypothetical protein